MPYQIVPATDADLGTATAAPGTAPPSDGRNFSIVPATEADLTGKGAPAAATSQQPEGGDLKHYAALAGETAAKIGANIVGLPGDTAEMLKGARHAILPDAVAKVGDVLDTPVSYLPTSQSIKDRMKGWGVLGNQVAQPRNEPERVVAATGEGAGTGAIGGLPGVALGAAGGALGELGRYAYEGTPHEQMAQVVGNLAPMAAMPVVGLGRMAGRALEGYKSWEPDYRAVGAALKGSMSDEGQATANLDQYLSRQQQGLGAVPDHQLTTFQAMADPGVGAMERQFSPLMAGRLLERKYANSEAAQQALQGKLPDQAAVAAAVPATQARVQQAVGAMGPGATTAEEAGAAVRGDLQAQRDAAANARRTATQPLYQAAEPQPVPRQALQGLLSEIADARSGVARNGSTDKLLGYMEQAVGSTFEPDRMVPTGRTSANGRPVVQVQPGRDAQVAPLDSLQKELYRRSKLPPTNPDAIDQETWHAVTPLRDRLTDILGSASPDYAQARLEYGRLSDPVNKMEADHLGKILATNSDRMGDYRLSDTAVAGKFLSRTDGPQAMAQLLRAYDGNRPAALDAVGDHLVYLMKQSGALTPDNTVNLKAMAQFRKQNAPALQNFQDLSGKSASAMTFQHMAERAQARAALMDKFQNGPNSPLVLQDQNPATGNYVLSPTNLNKFLDKHADDITNLFGKSHLNDLRQIAKEISPTTWSNNTKAPGGGSDTAQKSMTVLKAILSGKVSKTAENIASGATAAVGSGLGALVAGPAGAAAGAGGGAAVGKYVAGKLNNMAEARQKLTSDLLQDVLMNPARAKFVLEKYNAMNAPAQRNRVAEIIPYAMAVSHSIGTRDSQ